MPAPEGQTNGSSGDAGEQSTSTNPAVKTFTQEEVDAIIAQRARRMLKAEYGDLDDLKAKAKKLEELEAANQTESEKAAARAAEAERKAAEREAMALITLKRAAIIAAAAKAGVADPEDAVRFLLDSDEIEIGDDGNVKHADKAVAALVEKKPYLKGTAPEAPKPPAASGGGGFNGNDGKTLAQKIAEAEARGDWKEARRLKSAIAVSQMAAAANPTAIKR